MSTSMHTSRTHPAQWWEKTENDKVRCLLCPRSCVMKDGQTGFCFARYNQGGELISLAYANPSAIQIDSIEKKPLSHFLPGSSILSLGCSGCNMGCRFCQNWSLSKSKADTARSRHLEVSEAVRLAQQNNCESIGFTYNEPTIWGEYVIDVSRAAREQGIKSIMVTNGFISPNALCDVYEFIDGANIDLKAFSDEFYKKITLSRLQPILDTIQVLHDNTDVWIELTTLLIPGHNDSSDEIRLMCDWILSNLGPDVPLHFSAFHPDYKMADVQRTPASTLQRVRQLALKSGINYVYVGNIVDRDGSTTFCPRCGAELIVRDWHRVIKNVVEKGRCSCGEKIPGVFQD
jgi:pyruvate formate lyase activating enzyme